MPSLEEAPSGVRFAEDVDPRYRAIFDGPPANNYILRQTQLAIEKFAIEHPEGILDHAKVEELMLGWAETTLSRAFSGITRDPAFKDHPRFAGDISKIELADVEYYRDHDALPSE